MSALSFPFNVYLAAFASAFATTLLTLPLWRKWCLRTGLVDDPGHRKIHDAPIPLAGGLAVLTGLLLPLIAAVILLKLHFWPSAPAAPLAHGFDRREWQIIAILVGAVAITIFGWLDDRHELRPLPKFAGQLLIALLLAAAGVRITLFVPNIFFSYAVTALWLLTVINAFNFMDNMNGLCAGLGVIGAGCFGALAAADGQYLVALIALLACGALLGFLPHNFPQARAFLGDSGSHLTGYLLAVLAILPHFYTAQHPRRLAVLTPLVVLAIPLLDLAWVVLLRRRMGKPFYVGDTNHLSHRLVRAGLSRTTAVLLIWLAAAALGALVQVAG
ncbi:MAG: undecaprenyl/decaprenyl-phosphate alpha-N-acetylglucosaminyl 1-phosphate transferase [Pedosphaera sp.]|nr:undecaprenyl/decaprenyl-phosphate alpha-N-acetylglucosaminyl 1-phosphate transferase [Pedosphaera sp.]